MSTTAATLPTTKSLAGRRYDRVFFPIISVLILITVVIGFAKTYFLAGMVRAPLPSPIIHIHGAIFTSWIILLIVQTGLVSARRVDIHKKLGLFGFGLACVMVVLGLLASVNALSRQVVSNVSPIPGLDARTFFAIPIGDMIIFATLIYLGWALRFKGAEHKRLVLIATIGLIDAAVNRWPFAYVRTGPHILVDLTVYTFLVALMAYDLWSTHKIQKVTLWASLFLIVVQQLRVPIGFTHIWHRFADLTLGKI
jgi:hypothetical protein